MSSVKKIIAKNGVPMLSARHASKRLKCAADYVGKLCREGKLVGEQIDGAWFVREDSIALFEKARKEARAQRSIELTQQRKEESAQYRKLWGADDALAPVEVSAATPTFAVQGLIAAKWGRMAALSFGAAFLFAAVVYAGGSGKAYLFTNGQQLAASVSEVQSPFFGGFASSVMPAAAPVRNDASNFFSDVFAFLFGTRTPVTKIAVSLPVNTKQTVPATAAPAARIATNATTTAGVKQTIVQNNTYPVIERTVIKTQSGITQAELDAQLNVLSNTLRQVIFANTNSAPGPTYGGGGSVTTNLALAQRIDTLSGVAISGGTISGARLTNITSIDLASGCFSVAGVCITGGGSAAGSSGAIQFNTGGAFAASSTQFVWDATNNRLGVGTSTPLKTLSLGAGGIISVTSNDGSSNGCFAEIGGQLQYSNDCTTYQSFTASAAGGWTDSGTVVHLTTGTENVAIGTSTPYAKLTVWGADSSASTNAFAVVNAASTTLLSVNDAGQTTLINLFATGSTTLSTLTAGVTQLSTLSLSSALSVANGGTGSTTLGGLLTGNGTGVVTAAAVSSPLTFSGNTLSIQQATLAQNGYLSSTDFTTFNNKISSTSLSATYPLAYNSTTGVFTTNFGTTTTNTFSALNTFNGGLTANILTVGTSASIASTTLTGNTLLANATTTTFAISNISSSLLKTLSNGAVVAAVAGTDYQAAGSYATFAYPFPAGATTTQIAFNGGATFVGATTTAFAVTGSSTINRLNLTNALSIANGGTGTTSAPTYGQLLVGNNAGGYDLLATSSLGITGGGGGTFTSIGPAGQLQTGPSVTLASSTAGSDFTITASGNVITYNLPSASLSARGLLTSSDFTTFNNKISSTSLSATYPLAYNSTTGVFTTNFGTTTTNTFSQLQTFTAGILTNASSTLGNFTANFATTSQATTTNLAITGISSALLKTLSNGAVVAAVAGVDYATASTGAFPFTPTTAFGTAANATSTLIGFTNGLYATASSTITTLNASNLTVSNLFADASGTTTVTGNLIPASSNVYSLGSGGRHWKDLFLGPGSLYVNGQEVLHTDGSNNVVVSSSINQNLVVQTTGSANIELNPSGTGQLLIKSNINLTAGKSFTTSDSSAALFPSGVAAGNITVSGSAITNSLLNGGISITPNGTGSTYVTAGNFGIGNTSPAYRLDVIGAGNFTGNVSAANLTATGTLQVTGLTTLSGGLLSVASSTIGSGAQAGGLTISGGATTTGTAYFAVNVGIGNVAPSKTLDVTGTGRFSSTLTLSSTVSCTGGQALQTDSSGNVTCGTIASGGSSTGGGWTTNNIGSITLATSTDRVGVGATSTPYAKLAIVSGAAGTTTLAIVPAASQTANIIDIYDTSGVLSSVLTASGNFGLGTTSPFAKLSVAGNALISGTLSAGNTTLANATTTNLAITNILSGLLATNAQGTVVATSSISTNYLTGILGVANGGTGSTTLGGLLTGNGTGVVTAAAVSSPLTFSGNTLSIQQATLAQNGYLSSTDFTTFNNKISSTSLSATYPLAYNSTTGVFTTAFSTTTQNFWSNYNNFSSLFATNASTTNATTTNLHITSLGNGGLAVDVNGRVYAAATTTAGTGLTYSANSFSVNTTQNIAQLSNLTSNGFVKTINGNGTLTVDTTSYLSSTSLQTSALLASLIGDETGTGSLVFGTGATLSSTTLLASTTLQNATTTTFAITGITSSLLKTLSNGAVVAAVAGTDYTTPASLGAAYPFTPTNNFGVNTSATSTPLFAQLGLFASSTSHFAALDFAIATGTNLTITGSSTINGQFNALGGATFGSVTLANLSNALLYVNGSGSVLSTTTLAVNNGGTGSTTLTGILKGNGTGAVGTLVVGSGLTFDGTTLATNGAGITAIGPLGQTQTGGTQLLATSTTGTDFTITASSNTQTFNFPFASLSANGKLSSTDFATFNNKISSSSLTGTSVISYNSGTGVITTTGGTFGAGNYIFPGNASSSLLSAYGAYFGSTATSSFDSAGVLTLASALGIASGGTNNTSFSRNSLLYFDGTKIAATSSNSLYVGSLFATSTTATSTLAGGLSVANSLFVLQNGNIGIGNSTPGKTLDITGTARVSSTFTLSGNTSCVGGNALQTDVQGNVSCGTVSFVGITTAGGWSTNSIGDVTLATTSDRVGLGATTTPYAKLSILSGGAGTTTLALVPASGQTANILDIYNTSGALSSVFTAAGHLGIGTTSPFATLSVAGNGFFNSNLTASNITATGTLSAGGTTLVTLSNGNVGVGTSSPMSHLSIAGGNLTQVASGNPTLATTVPAIAAAHSHKTFVSGNYAYEAEFEGGLRIFDVTNPKQPVLVGTYSTYTAVDDVIVSGKYAYLADATAGVVILDVSNPTSPTLLGTYPVSATPYAVGIALSGKYLYATDMNAHAVRVIDVSNPTAPALVGSYNGGALASPRAITVSGKYAYVTDYVPAVYVLDISVPSAPTKISSSYTTNVAGPNSVYKSGNYLYVADVSAKGMYILNASNPTALTLVGTYNPGGTASFEDVKVAGNYAYLADDASTLTQVDVSTKSAPVLVGSYALGGVGRGVALVGKYAYVSSDTQGLEIVDINGIESPSASIGSLATNIANISDSLTVGTDIYAGGGLNVGISGIFSRGGLSVFGSTTLSAPLTVNASTTLAGNLSAISGNIQFASTTLLGNTLLVNATTTSFFASVASTTNLTISSVQSSLLKTNANGQVVAAVAGTDYVTGAGLTSAFPFTPTTNFGATANSTSTPVWFTTGLQASSTSKFASATFYGSLQIGTSSSAHALTVSVPSDGIFIKDTLNNNGLLLNANSIQAENAGDSVAKDLTIQAAGGNTLLNPFSGSVGIGTTSPFATLSVAGNTFITGSATTTGSFAVTGSTTVAGILNAVGGAQFGTLNASGIFTSTATAANVFPYASSTALTVSGTGYFGTASTTNLTISGIASGNLLKTSTGGSVIAAVAGTDYVTGAALSSAYPFQLTGNATSTLTQFNGGLTAYASSTIGNGTQAGGLTISGGATTTGNAYFGGNVGIGLVSPSYTLDVSGTAHVSGATTLDSTLSTHAITIQSGGAGTATLSVNPSGRLTVNSSDTVSGAFIFTFGGVSSAILQANGNLGLGTTSPFANLSVHANNGSTNTTLFAIGSSTQSATSTLFSISNTGLITGQNFSLANGTTSAFAVTGSTTIAGAFNSVASNLLASTTLLGNSLFGFATTTNFAITGTTNTLLKTLSNGAVVAAVAGTDYATPATIAGAFPFTPTTNFGVNTSATSTPLFAQLGLFASSTSHFAALDFAIATGTNLTITGSSTVNGAFNIGGALSANLSAVIASTTLTGNSLFTNATTTNFGVNNITAPASQALNIRTQNVSSATGPAINITAGNNLVGASAGGALTLTSGNSASGNGGDITLQTGIGTDVAGFGAINFTQGANVRGGFDNSGIFTIGTDKLVIGSGNAAAPNTNVGIGTTSPYAKLSVAGQVVGQNFTATSTVAINTFPLLVATTATTTNFAVTGITSSLLKTNSLGQLIAAVAGTDYATLTTVASAYPFALAGNATSTLTQFNGGLTAYASSTIGNGTQAGGLTISGGATTTGNSILQGSLAVTGATTLSSALTYGGVTLSNAVTGTGNMVLSSSPTLVTPTIGAALGTSLALSPGALASEGITVSYSDPGPDNFRTKLFPNKVQVRNSGGGGDTFVSGTEIGLGNLIFRNSTTGETSGDGFELNLSGLNASIINHEAGSLTLSTSNTPRFTITSAGLVGIGTTSPYRQLSVGNSAVFGGDVLAGSFTATSSASLASTTLTGNSLFNFATTTNFAITGTANTLLKTLSNGAVVAAVAGTDYVTPATIAGAFPFTPTTNFGALANSTSTPLWLRAGLQASSTAYLADINTVGVLNFASTSVSATTTLISINGQTYLSASTTVNNLGLGLSALSHTTTGSQNVGVGDFVLKSNTLGSSNVGVGYNALNTNTSGNSNIAVGPNTLSQLVSGQANVAIGDSALTYNITGSLNTAIGQSASSFNLSATNTVAIGQSAGAGQFAYTAQGYTSVGYQSGFRFQTGADYNTLFGYQSGSKITTGYANLLLGASVTEGNLTTGSGNIGLGNNIFFPSATASNQLNLGGLIFGTLPATSTAFRLPTSGSLGVGTSSPFSKFAIQSNNGDTATTLFAIGSSTQSATSTLFSVSNTGSTTLFQIPSSLLKTNANGTIVAAVAGTDYVTGAALTSAFPFTPTTNFGVNTSATSTPLYAVNGLFASSTSHFANIDFTGATSTGTFAVTGSSTIAGQFNAVGGATFGTLTAGASTLASLTVTGNTTLANATSTSLFAQSLLANTAAFGQTGTTTITSTGFLGVGTSSPFANLSIHNNASSTSLSLFSIGSTTNTGGVLSNSTLFSIANNGSAALTVLGTAASGFAVTIPNNYSGTGISVTNTANGTISGTIASFGLTSGSLTGTGVSIPISLVTSGTALNISGGLSGNGSPLTGKIINVSYTRQQQSGTDTVTGNFLNMNRGYEAISGTLNVTGDLATLISRCAVRGGACNDSSSVLSLYQLATSSTGTAFNVQVGGAGNIATFAGTSTGNGVSVQIASTSATAYAFDVLTQNGLFDAFRVAGNNDVGIGSSSPWANLSVQANNGDTDTVLFAIGSSTQSATSTLFSVSNTGSTTLFQIPSSLLKTNANGTIVAAVAGTDYVTGAALTSAFPFTPTTNFGVNTSATSTPLYAVNGLFASSTSHFANIDFTGATSTGTFAVTGSSTIGSNFNALGTVALGTVTTSGNLTVGGIQSITGSATGNNLSLNASLSSGTGLLLSSTGALTTGTGIKISASVGGGLSAFSGNQILVSGTRNYSGGGTVTDTGSYLNLNRTALSSAGTYNVSGDLTTLISNCIVAGGSCNDSSSILSLYQYATSTNATGAVFSVNTGGIGQLIALNATSSNATSTIASYNGQTFLTASTTGFNTGLGLSALANITSGSSNTALGYQALLNATSTSSNVGIGSQALKGSAARFTGSRNVAVGRETLRSVTTGSDNAALGDQVLTTNTSGDNNTAFGSAALFLNSTGSNNSAFGTLASQNTTGSDNSVFGVYAGYSISTGYANTLIGGNTTLNNTITTGGGNIGLGANVFFPSATANNQLNIGNLLFGIVPATSTAFALPTSGSLGVGTSSPFAKFAIQSNNGDTATTLFAIGSTTATANSTLFSVSNTGSTTISNGVNITAGCFAVNGACLATGGASFGYPFPLSGNATSTLTQFNGGLTAFASSTIGDGTQFGGLTISGGATTTGNAYFGAKVGIGTTSPFANLSVQKGYGSTASILFAIASSTSSSGSSASSVFSISKTGLIRATLDSSTSTLIVLNGETFLTASSTTGNTSLGFSALANTDPLNNGQFNTAIGYQALNSIDSLGGSTAVGYKALKNTKNDGSGNGAGNNAFGFEALMANTTGNNNNAFGSYALISNTSGSTNNAFGNTTLQAVTSGSNNSAFGDNVGTQLIAGSNNAFFGAQAAFVQRGGDQNVAVGVSALYAARNATSSTVVGAGIASNGTLFNAQGFSALGYQSLFNISTGADYNTVFGYQSGFNITSGYGNIGVGASSTANITTGNGNLGLGNNTIFPSATASNQLNIGNFIYGTVPATSTAFKLPTSGSLGVGTSSPFAKFAIQSNNGDTATTLFAIGSSTQSATSTLFSISNTGNSFLSGTASSSAYVANWGSSSVPAYGFSGSTAGIYAANSTSLVINNGGLSSLILGSGSVTTTGDFSSQLTGSFLLRAQGAAPSAAAPEYAFVGQTDTGMYLSSGALGFSTAGLERLRLSAAGNVGIGSTSPFANLSINANNGDTNQVLFAIGSSTASATSTLFSVDNTGAASTTKLFGAFLTPCNSGNVLTWAAGVFGCAVDQTSAGAANPFTWASNYGVVAAATTSPFWAQNGVFASSTSHFVNADFSGNVGLSTSTPFARLSVDTSGLAAGVPEFVIGSSTRTDVVVSQGGWVGIGTAAPSANLEVSGANAGATLNGLNLTNASSATSTAFAQNFRALDITGNATSTSAITSILQKNFSSGGLGGNGDLAFSTLNFGKLTEVARLTAAGSLGIGTTTPWGLLSINPNGITGPSFVIGSSTLTSFIVTNGGNVGVGTSSPYARFSVSQTAAVSQFSLAYDSADATDFRTDATGNLWIVPQGSAGGNVLMTNDNLWVCTGGSITSNTCPAGTPSGKGNIIVQNKISIGTTTPTGQFTVASSTNAGIADFISLDTANTLSPRIVIGSVASTTRIVLDNSAGIFRVLSSKANDGSASTQLLNIDGGSGFVGIGTTSPSQQLSLSQKLFVGAGNPTAMGTATSTFQGDVLITGKLDVSTIDPVYTIDGTKYATYGVSSVGVKEEVSATVTLADKNPETGKYEYSINFNNLEKGSDLWLFYQVTTFGDNWKNLVANLTPGFDGSVYYTKDPATNTLHVVADKPGEVSMRLISTRFDSRDWSNIRPDQDGGFAGFQLQSK